MKGFIVITRDVEKIRSRTPDFVEICPRFYWVPCDPIKFEDCTWACNGGIQLVPYMENKLTMYCNEEGKYNNSRPSAMAPCDWSSIDILHDDLYIAGPTDDDGNETPITLEQAKVIVLKVVPGWVVQV